MCTCECVCVCVRVAAAAGPHVYLAGVNKKAQQAFELSMSVEEDLTATF